VIPWNVLAQGGAVVILAGVVWMIVSGRLVPRSALTDAHTERDRWAEAAREAMQQNNALLTGARVTHDVLKALPDVATGERQ
jgi:hypothetical protein